MKILFSLFCKDRKKYALNLIKSLNLFNFNNVESKLLIYDSSNINKEKLNNTDINLKFDYVLSKTPNINKGELGNLYINMNKALDYAKAKNFDYIFFLQDDNQVLRNVSIKEFKETLKIFDLENVIHINPSFHRGFESDFKKKIKLSDNKKFYVDLSSSCHDVGIYCVKKLKEIQFQIGNSEDERDKKYYEQGYRSAKVIYPFLHYLPWVMSSRIYNSKNRNFFKKYIRNLVIAINAYGVNAGFNPFKEMTDTSISKLFKRNKNFLPTAEIYLENSKILKKPWAYDSFYDYRKILKIEHLFKLDFIFNGSIEYIKSVKELEKISLNNNFERSIE